MAYLPSKVLSPAATPTSYFRLLTTFGDDVNARPVIREGRTALERAAEHGRVDLVQILLSAGAKPREGEIDFKSVTSLATNAPASLQLPIAPSLLMSLLHIRGLGRGDKMDRIEPRSESSKHASTLHTNALPPGYRLVCFSAVS